MSERHSLEVEVAAHMARVAELTAALGDIEENVDAAADPSARHRAQLLRMELKGREAAVQVGSARLRMIRD